MRRMWHGMPEFASLGALALAAMITVVPAQAADKIRIGKSVANSFAFSGIDVGIDAKIWESVGLELEVSAFRGDAQMQQALTSKSVDFGLGSGPGLGYRAKGVPAIGVAALADKPSNVALVVTAKGPIKSVADLKGQRIGTNSAGSLTDWLTREVSRQQGWGPEGIIAVPMGAIRTKLAAMKTGDLVGTIITTENAIELEEEGEVRMLMTLGDVVKDFHTHVIFARDELIEKRPDIVERFLKGWFKTVAFMKSNKDFTVKSVSKAMEVRIGIIEKSYATEMEILSDDGRFNPAAIELIRHSLKELQILDKVPEAKGLYSDRFVPVKF